MASIETRSSGKKKSKFESKVKGMEAIDVNGMHTLTCQ
jgi:hypothetical protein